MLQTTIHLNELDTECTDVEEDIKGEYQGGHRIGVPLHCHEKVEKEFDRATQEAKIR